MGFWKRKKKSEDAAKESITTPADGTTRADIESNDEIEEELSKGYEISPTLLKAWRKVFVDGVIDHELARTYRFDNKRVTNIIFNVINDILGEDGNQKKLIIAIIDMVDNSIMENVYYTGSFDENTYVELYNAFKALIRANYEVCFYYKIDFAEAYSILLSLRDNMNQWFVKDTSSLFKMSFSEFYNLPEKSTEVPFISDFFWDRFDSLLSEADAEDIRALYKFGIRYENVLTDDYAECLEDSLSLFERYDAGVSVGDLEECLEIGRCYPHLLGLAFDNYADFIIYLIKDAIDENDTLLEQACNIVFYEMMDVMTLYHEYRSEDFSSIESHWEDILCDVIDYFNGYTLTATIDAFNTCFGISKEEMVDVVLRFVDRDYMHNGGEVELDDSYKIHRLIKLMSNRFVFEYVVDSKPEFLKMFED